MNNANTGFAYSPPPGVVQEVKVQTASFDASAGFLTGVVVNMSLKSGTNQLHGQTYYFNQNPAVDANQFFANQFGSAKYLYKAHRWGGVVTGPVYLPKLYDGRNRTFFMYGYEGMWTFDPVSIGFEAVPTPAQRTGDFSNLLALGTALWVPTAIVWAAFVLMAIGSDLRARAEETLLRQAFDSSYREYCARTRRFVPGIY